MKIEILDEAQQDLIEGFHFYEKRESGLGSYFLDCLFSDIDSLILYLASIGLFLDITGYYLNAFPLPFTIQLNMTWLAFMQFWIVAGIQHGSEGGYGKPKNRPHQSRLTDV